MGWRVIIGIDLGTTNCGVAVYRGGEIEMVPNSLGHVLTPSAVHIDGDTVLTGLAARERQSTHPGGTITAFKRYMGSDKKLRLGKMSFLPEELSALMLRSLKADAEAYLSEQVTEAVITVPAYFNDRQRKATRRAGQIAGLTVERLINEPTAAALAYGLHQRDLQTKFMVFDLGGGTFDVSILEIFEGVIEVRATAGDNRLGGEDFNEVLIDLAVGRLKDAIGQAPKDDETLYQRLREAAERTRRALTDAPAAAFTVVRNGEELKTEIDSAAFEAACEPLLTRLRDPVMRSLRDSGVAIESLDEIVLVGGATRMPLVRKAVTRMFSRFPSNSVNPDEAVARGAAVQGALKGRHADFREVVLTDVCPYTLGVETNEIRPGGKIASGIFAPIIERNCVVPASREKTFSTLQDNQPAVKFPIYQGESRLTTDNIHLGDVTIPVPRAKAGETPINCRFSYDINGLLEVDLHVPETDERRQLVIVDRAGVSEAEIDQRRKALARLKTHPRNTDAVRATLARANRCYENRVGAERDHVGDLISRFESLLEGQDPRQCEAARAEFSRLLDQLENETFL